MLLSQLEPGNLRHLTDESIEIPDSGVTAILASDFRVRQSLSSWPDFEVE